MSIGECDACGKSPRQLSFSVSYGIDTYACAECRGEEIERCPDCGGLTSDDGYTIDPEKCCFTCKAD